jgi:hypothetical protein
VTLSMTHTIPPLAHHEGSEFGAARVGLDAPAAAGYSSVGYPGAGYPGYAGYPAARPDWFTRTTMRLWDRSPRWAAPAAILACFGGAAAYVLYTNPTDGNADSVPTCLVKLTTGFDCPGCGGTRAFYYALHGNLPAAARHHALFIFALPFLVYLYVAWAGERLFRRRLPALKITPTMIGVFLAAWAVFSVARNLPWAPFTWLYV